MASHTTLEWCVSRTTFGQLSWLIGGVQVTQMNFQVRHGAVKNGNDIADFK